VTTGLAWIRRRQRLLARAVLGLFVAAWLQAAVVPCVMAHGDDGHAAAHHAGAAAHHGADAAEPCMYCPPGADHGAPAVCDSGDCPYPHEPQVDARAAGFLFATLPVAYVVPALYLPVPSPCSDPSVAEAIPRIRLSVSYCRFIE
jgi:hypothetical protein